MIHRATGDDVEFVRTLFREYADGLGVDLSFQDFESELADPLGFYVLVLLSERGCVALRRIDDETCEMKRLYVRPGHRGVGLGRVLAQALLDEARRLGYSAILLDTLDEMETARELYASLGFVEVPPYYFNPIAGAHYLKAELK